MDSRLLVVSGLSTLDFAEQFRRSLAAGRLASTYLFVGPAGVGKRRFAIKLAQALLCETNPEQQLEPCGVCPACRQVEADSHPDLQIIEKPDDKSFIPVELFVGDREHRMREGLCHHIGLKAFRGGRKIAIIDDADYLNQEGANCLLKTLEEPPPKSLLILIGTSAQRQLPTIRSRCQIVRFAPLPDAEIAQQLLAGGTVSDAQEAAALAELAGGSLARAVEFSDPALREMRTALLELLSGEFALLEAAGEVNRFVEAAGKKAAARRQRLRQVIDLAIQFYRQLMRAVSGGEPDGDQELRSAVGRRAAGEVSTETAAACLERCLDAHFQVESNANQATLVECWLDDLIGITT